MHFLAGHDRFAAADIFARADAALTTLLQAVDALAATMKVLYVSGEESGAQIALRARRLGRVGDKVMATPLPRGAGTITSLVRADGMLVVPALSGLTVPPATTSSMRQ